MPENTIEAYLVDTYTKIKEAANVKLADFANRLVLEGAYAFEWRGDDAMRQAAVAHVAQCIVLTLSLPGATAERLLEDLRLQVMSSAAVVKSSSSTCSNTMYYLILAEKATQLQYIERVVRTQKEMES